MVVRKPFYLLSGIEERIGYQHNTEFSASPENGYFRVIPQKSEDERLANITELNSCRYRGILFIVQF